MEISVINIFPRNNSIDDRRSSISVGVSDSFVQFGVLYFAEINCRLILIPGIRNVGGKLLIFSNVV